MREYELYKKHNYSKIGDAFDDIPSYQDFNYKRREITPYLVDEEVEENKFCEIVVDMLEKIEKFKTKQVLSKMRDIIMKELKKEYYQNAANVREIIDINTHPVDDYENNISYMHIENMCIWQNGFYTFNRFNLTCGGSGINSSKDKKQVTVPIRRKKLVCRNK